MRPLDSKMKNILYASGVETYTAARQYLHERSIISKRIKIPFNFTF